MEQDGDNRGTSVTVEDRGTPDSVFLKSTQTRSVLKPPPSVAGTRTGIDTGRRPFRTNVSGSFNTLGDLRVLRQDYPLTSLINGGGTPVLERLPFLERQSKDVGGTGRT